MRVYFNILSLSMWLFGLPFLAKAQCVAENKAFKAGEKINYQVAYNWGFIWVNAGEATFEVRSTELNGTPAYHLYSEGVSYEKWDWIYRVRDVYQSYVRQSDLKPLKFIRDTSEGKYEVKNQYEFNYEAQVIQGSVENSESPKKDIRVPMQPCTMDVLSMIYQARNIDYSKYKEGDKIPITLIIDGEIYNLYLRFLGKEVLKTRDKKKYSCYKFKPLLVEGTIFSGGENMTVWVTDDENRVPIMIEAKILVGAVKAYMEDAEMLKNVMRSLVKE